VGYVLDDENKIEWDMLRLLDLKSSC
jgi:hypothetical protein